MQKSTLRDSFSTPISTTIEAISKSPNHLQPSPVFSYTARICWMSNFHVWMGTNDCKLLLRCGGARMQRTRKAFRCMATTPPPVPQTCSILTVLSFVDPPCLCPCRLPDGVKPHLHFLLDSLPMSLFAWICAGVETWQKTHPCS